MTKIVTTAKVQGEEDTTHGARIAIRYVETTRIHETDSVGTDHQEIRDEKRKDEKTVVDGNPLGSVPVVRPNDYRPK